MKNFLQKAKPYLILNGIILALFSVYFAIFGIFPFGKGTLAHYDELSQIIPQSTYILDFLDGKSPLFYSTVNGLGGNTFGALSYFIFSPFNFILLFFGRSAMLQGFNILFVIKIMLISSVGMWFAKRHFENFGVVKLLIVSLSYGFSGFMFMMFTYFSFIDYLIFMPLLVESFLYLRKTKKILPLTAVLSLMMLNCFGVGCFVMLYLFLIFAIFAFLCLEKEERKVVTIKTMCALLCAIGIASPVLVPSFVTFLGSGRNSGLSTFTIISENAMPSKIIVEITEMFTFVFSIIYLIKCDKKDKFNTFLLVCEILSFILIVFDLSLRAFNMGTILGYYSRFGFVSAFLTFFLSCKAIDSYYNFEGKAPKFSPLYIGVILIGAIYILACTGLYNSLTSILSSQSCLFPVLLFYVLENAILLVPFFISYGYKKKIKGHLFVITLILLIFSIFGNFMNYFSGGIVDSQKIYTMSSFSKYIDSHDRVKVRDYGYLALTSGLAGYSNASEFSSLADKEGINALKDIGYISRINNSATFSGTLLSDLVVDTKYYIYPYERNEDYLELVSSEYGFYLYKNKICPDPIKILKKEVNFTGDILQNQQLLFEALGGTGEILEKVTPTLNFTNANIVDGTIYQTKGSVTPSEIRVEYDIPEEKLLYFYLKDLKAGACVEIDDCNFEENTIVELNRKNADMLINLYNSASIDSFEFYTMDIEKVKNLFNSSSNLRQEYNKLLGNIRLSQDDTVILPYSDIKGYTVLVNGKKVDFSNKFSNFMTLELKSGENLIEITYNNPIYKYILFGVLIGIVLIIIGALFSHFAFKISGKLVDILLFSLAIIISVVFIVIPCNVNYYTFFKTFLIKT